MRKKIFIFICLFFIFQTDVFAQRCPSNAPNKTNDNSVVALYENISDKINNLGSECGGKSSSTSSMAKESIYIDNNDQQEANKSDYECYKKRKVLIMLDDSNSMGKSKIDQAEELIKVISQKLNDSKDKMAVCYFQKECLKNGQFVSPDKFENVNLERQNKNTNFVKAYEKIDSMLSNLSDYIPIVFFITDGYPTEHGDVRLGYLSSSRYGFKAANKLENLIGKMNNGDFTNSSNVYRKNNPRIITVGVGISSSDNFAKFVLNPNENNKNDLADSGEEKRLKDLVTNPESSQFELVAGACSFPDKSGIVAGMYKTSKSSDGSTKYIAKFKGNDLSAAMGDLGKDVCFTAGNGNFSTTLQYCYNKNKNGSCSYENVPSWSFSIVGSDASGKIIKLNNNFFSNHKVNYRLISTSGFKEYDFAGVNFNYHSVFGQYFGKKAINNLENVLVNNTDKDPLKFDESYDSSYFTKKDKIKVKHTNAVLKDVVVDKNVTYAGKEYDKIKVGILITEDVDFGAGTLKNITTIPSGGRGFSFDNVSITNTVKWYYKKFAKHDSSNPIKPSDPIVKLSQGKNEVEVKLSEISLDVNVLDSLVWKKIKTNYIANNSIKISKDFKTIDSNNKNNKDSNLQISVNQEYSCSSVKNADSSTDFCKITYNVSQLVGCVHKTTLKFEYGATCDNSDYISNTDGKKYYYIPYAQEKGNININITTNNFSSVNGINFEGKNVCSFGVSGAGGGDDPPSKLSNIIYRSIDVTEPFSSIVPINWSSWYGITSNNTRLTNSYSLDKLHYLINLDNGKIKEINADTNNNSNVYLGLNSMNNDGTNEFVNERITSKNNFKKYCPIGEFVDSSDPVNNCDS